MKRALKVALVAGIVAALGVVGLIQATAQQQPGITVTRAINPSSVPAAGGQVTVSITIDGSYGVGSVVETLPAGFSYVRGSSAITPAEDGRKVSFPLVADTSFSYKVNAPGSAGQHQFSGELIYGVDKADQGRRNRRYEPITVAAAQQPGITVTRAINPSSVPAAGGQVTVSITIDGSYGVGSVVETVAAASRVLLREGVVGDNACGGRAEGQFSPGGRHVLLVQG